MKLTMLGTGNALVTECYNTCFVLEENNQYLLVDGGGGNGILHQLKHAGINWKNIKSIFVTHKHLDHITGIIWIIRIRGFEKQEIEKTMLLLLEETGELAKAIRKDYTDMRIDYKKLNHYTNIENEIADVFIVLTCICNKLNINLFDAVYKKETENVTRNWDKKENKNG